MQVLRLRIVAGTVQTTRFLPGQTARLLAFIMLLPAFPVSVPVVEADSETQLPPVVTIQNTPVGTVFQLGDHVQIFKDIKKNELLAKLMTIPIGALLLSWSRNAPTYFLFAISPFIHSHTQWASTANDYAHKMNFLIRYLLVMNTLRSTYHLIYNLTKEGLLSAKRSLEQWYQWENCDRRVGQYPVYIMQPELASLFYFQVSLSDKKPAALEITRIGEPNIKSPLPWQKLSSALKSKGMASLSISIETIDHQTYLRLRYDAKRERLISLSDTNPSWDLNLMGQWCSHNEQAFYSVFHPGFIQAVAYILSHPHITDMTVFEPVQLSDQNLLQTSSASLYTLPDGNDQHQIIWSDQSAQYSGPGFIVWSMNQHFGVTELTLADSEKGPDNFRELNIQQQWSREMLTFIEVILSAFASSNVEQKHQRVLEHVSRWLLTLKLAPQPATLPPLISVEPPPQSEVAVATSSMTVSLLREFLRPLHSVIMGTSGRALYNSISPVNLHYRFLPLCLSGPMYMMDPDQSMSPPSPSDKTPPKKPLLKKSDSEKVLIKKRMGWDDMRQDSSRSLFGKSGLLKDRKGSRMFGFHRRRTRSTHSTSSQSSGDHSRHSSVSYHSSNSQLISSGSDLGSSLETTRLLELMSYDEEDFDDILNWLSWGFSAELIPANSLLLELTQTALDFLQQVITELSVSVARLPGLIAETTTIPLDSLQSDTRIELLLQELTHLRGQFEALLTVLEKSAFTGDLLQINSIPVHEFWLQQFQALNRLGIELTTPPMQVFSDAFPPLSPLKPDSQGTLVQTIEQFQRRLRDLKMVIQESLCNPALIQGTFIDPTWFDICSAFEASGERLLQNTRQLDTKDEFYHVDFERIRYEVQQMQAHLQDIYQLSSGRRLLINPRTRQALAYSSGTADNHLLSHILLGEDPVHWFDVSLAQLHLLNQQLTEDAQNMKDLLERAQLQLARTDALPPFFHHYINGLLMRQKHEVIEDIVSKTDEVQHWLDHQHHTIHTKIITSKKLAKDEGEVDVKVDVYEPALTRVAYLYHRLIATCGDWRAGCPAMGSILSIILKTQLEEAADKAEQYLSRMDAVISQMKGLNTDKAMGPLYYKFFSYQKMLTTFLRRYHQLIQRLSDKTVTNSDPTIIDAMMLLDSMDALEQQLQEIGITELSAAEVVKIVKDNALNFNPALLPLKRQLLDESVPSATFAAIQPKQIIAMTEELLRLNLVASMIPPSIPSQGQRELLRWNTNVLALIKPQVHSGHLMMSHRMLNDIKMSVPFLTEWSDDKEQTVIEFVMERYKELVTELPWLGTDPATSRIASIKKAQIIAEPSIQDPSIQELQPLIKQAVSMMTMEVRSWSLIHDFILRSSPARDQLTTSIWRSDYEAPAAIFPDELHHLPFSEEIQYLWQQNDAQTHEATIDTEEPPVNKHSAILSQNTGTPESSHDFSVQVYLPESEDPGTRYHARLQKAKRRHAGGVNINGLVQSWKTQVNTAIPYASAKMGAFKGDPEDTPPLLSALITAPAQPISQHKMVQCNVPDTCLDQRYQLLHFDRVFPVKLAMAARDECNKLLTQLKNYQFSLYLLNKSNVKDIRKLLAATERLHKEWQACRQSPLPTLESLLPRVPVTGMH